MRPDLFELKNAAIKLYCDASIPVSTCYRFVGLKKLQAVYYEENDYRSEIAAKQLCKQAKDDGKGNICLIPVSYSLADPKTAEQEILLFMSEYQGADSNSIIICDTLAAKKLVEIKERTAANKSHLFFPDYVCDINVFWEDELVSSTYYIDITTPEMREKINEKLPFECKTLSKAEVLIIFTSAIETWENAIYAYRKIYKEYHVSARLVIVDDLTGIAPVWFSRGQINRAFKIFRTLIKQDILAYTCQAKYLDSFLHEALNQDAIMFLPQIKTYWMHELSKSHCDKLNYYVIDNSIEDIISYNGSIGMQFIYDDILRFSNFAKDKKVAETYKAMYSKKEFNGVNMWLYWANQWLGSRFCSTSMLLSCR